MLLLKGKLIYCLPSNSQNWVLSMLYGLSHDVLYTELKITCLVKNHYLVLIFADESVSGPLACEA